MTAIPFRFQRKFLALGWPLILQHFFRMLFRNVDMIFISGLGTASIAAGGLVNQYQLVFIMVMLAISFAMFPIQTQCIGARQEKDFVDYSVYGMAIMFGLGLIFSVMFYALLPQLLSFWNVSDSVSEQSISYSKGILWTIPMWSVCFALENGLKSLECSRAILWIKVFTIGLNTVLTWAFVNGTVLFPSLGIFGAGIATSIAALFELLVSILYFFKRVNLLDYRIDSNHESGFFWRADLWRTTMKNCLVLIPQDVLWAVGILLYSRAFSELGTGTLAVYNVTCLVGEFADSVSFGLMGATSVLIGQELGGLRLNRAKTLASAILKWTTGYSFGISILLVTLLPVFEFFYGLGGEQSSLFYSFSWLFVPMVPVKMWFAILLIGILRSGGDFTATALIELLLMYLVAIPLILMGSLYYGWNAITLYFVVCMEVSIKTFLFYLRYKKGVWLKSLVS